MSDLTVIFDTIEPFIGPALPLSLRQTLACVDDSGRIRCPSCGRFSRLADIRPVPFRVRTRHPDLDAAGVQAVRLAGAHTVTARPARLGRHEVPR